jgi:hypothetical protein
VETGFCGEIMLKQRDEVIPDKIGYDLAKRTEDTDQL